MFGHRPDGKRLKDMDPIIQIPPYLMPMRCDSQVFLQYKLDYEKMSRYIVSKSRDGEKITFMQIIVAAYVRTVALHPEVNRFIFNKQYYARNNCSVSYAVLKDPQNPESSETTVRIEFDLTDTIWDVRDRMNHAVETTRAMEDGDFVIRLAKFVLGIPGLTTAVVAAAKLLDRYGLLPGFLCRELPFYSGLFITNNGSIGLPAPMHHIYNFGNVGQFIGMGAVTKEAFTEPDGKVRMRRWLPLGIVVDERIRSGAHYSYFLSDLLKFIADPTILEAPPEEVRFENGVEYHVAKIAKKPD